VGEEGLEPPTLSV